MTELDPKLQRLRREEYERLMRLIADLKGRIRELEMENARLRAGNGNAMENVEMRIAGLHEQLRREFTELRCYVADLRTKFADL